MLAEITGGDAELLREMSAQTGGLQQQLNTLGVDITDVESRLGQQIVGLEARIDEATAQQLEELTGLRSEFLTTLSASEAAANARNQGLSDQLTEQITGVRGETVELGFTAIVKAFTSALFGGVRCRTILFLKSEPMSLAKVR